MTFRVGVALLEEVWPVLRKCVTGSDQDESSSYSFCLQHLDEI